MSLQKRLNKIEKTMCKPQEVHFIGWANCRWERAAGLNRMNGESKDEFFKRVIHATDKKWIWCD